jgi:hypothetical protein
MSNPIKIYTFGLKGVNVDKDPIELEDDELQQAQNAVTDVLSGTAALRNRPGLIPFNDRTAAGSVLGGIGVPLVDTKTAAISHTIYIGRYTT